VHDFDRDNISPRKPSIRVTSNSVVGQRVFFNVNGTKKLVAVLTDDDGVLNLVADDGQWYVTHEEGGFTFTCYFYFHYVEHKSTFVLCFVLSLFMCSASSVCLDRTLTNNWTTLNEGPPSRHHQQRYNECFRQ
jgi:hypothetical protein